MCASVLIKTSLSTCQHHRHENVSWEKKFPQNLHTTKFLGKVCSGLEAVSTKINEYDCKYQSIECRLNYAFGMQDRFKRDKTHNPETIRSIYFAWQLHWTDDNTHHALKRIHKTISALDLKHTHMTLEWLSNECWQNMLSNCHNNSASAKVCAMHKALHIAISISKKQFLTSFP